jgi:hypothetical protein
MGFGGAGGIQCVCGMFEISRLKMSCSDGLRKLIKVEYPPAGEGPSWESLNYHFSSSLLRAPVTWAAFAKEKEVRY